MPIENCACGGNNVDRFYSLFTCDHANCNECYWTNNKCCNGCYSDDDCSTHSSSSCLNYYDIKMQNVITSRIKSFGYCKNHKALGIQFIDGSKKLILNVEEDVYQGLVDLNKDLLYMYFKENICLDESTCIDIS